MKKLIVYLLFLLPWFLGGLIFGYDNEFYTSLNIPLYALPGSIISIIWTIIYALIAYSIYLVNKKESIFKNNDYLYVLLTNYLANNTFLLFFFTLRSPFLAFVDTLIVLISSVFLFIETKNTNKKASYFLIPYIVYNVYALILSFSIYIMNF